jgi:hypothetical protein
VEVREVHGLETGLVTVDCQGAGGRGRETGVEEKVVDSGRGSEGVDGLEGGEVEGCRRDGTTSVAPVLSLDLGNSGVAAGLWEGAR